MTFSYLKLGLGEFRNPGPGLMPCLIGTFLVALSSLLLITTLVGKGDREELLDKKTQVNYRRFCGVVVSLILYGLLLEILGFVLCTFLLLFVLFWGMGLRIRFALTTSVLTVLITHFVFSYFGLRFPPGILTLLGFY
jgi:putative tricarboxylic transport membrane protein